MASFNKHLAFSEPIISVQKTFGFLMKMSLGRSDVSAAFYLLIISANSRYSAEANPLIGFIN